MTECGQREALGRKESIVELGLLSSVVQLSVWLVEDGAEEHAVSEEAVEEVHLVSSAYVYDVGAGLECQQVECGDESEDQPDAQRATHDQVVVSDLGEPELLSSAIPARGRCSRP